MKNPELRNVIYQNDKSHLYSDHWPNPVRCCALVATVAVSVGLLAAAPLPSPAVINTNPADTATFTDVSVAAGISEDNSSWGAAWGDYDRDGYIDVMTVGHLLKPHVSICQLW